MDTSYPPRVQTLIDQLHLSPHPEGGWYKESYRAAVNDHQERAASTAIYFLLAQQHISHFHRIDSDELWHHYEGDPVRVHILNQDGYQSLLIGSLNIPNAHPQGMVPAGSWFAAETELINHHYALVGCTVAPAFDFKYFELAKTTDLIADFPQHQDLIRRLTLP